MSEVITNVVKNQVAYYSKEHIKNGDTITNTEDYLNELLNTYRENFRQIAVNSSGISEEEDAKLLEEVLNSIKKVQNQITNDSSNDDILKIISQSSYKELLSQLFEVNPNLFRGLGLIMNTKGLDLSQGQKNVVLGKILENFMADFTITIESAQYGISYDILKEKDNNYHNTGGKMDSINSGIFNISDGIINQSINQIENSIAKATFNLQSKTNQSRYQKFKEQGITQDFFINGNVAKNNGSRQIKVDTVGLIGEIEITATSTILERVASALSMATFTDKNIGGKKKSIHLGKADPQRVFMTVAPGNDYYYKLYRYSRMQSCFNNHSTGLHPRAPEYFYRIRQIYELTGGQQKMSRPRDELEQKMADIINGNNGRAKYLVLNEVKQGGRVKVIPTAKLVDLMTLRLNKLLDKRDPISKEQALGSRVELAVGNILNDSFTV